MKKAILLFFLLLNTACFSSRGSVYNSDGSQADVQAKINSARNGDTVVIPRGDFTWAGPVTVSASITIAGSGYTPSTHTGGGTGCGAPSLGTVINFTGGRANDCIKAATGQNGGVLRITGISFAGYGYAHNAIIEINGSPSSDPFRIDNCIFDGGNDLVVLVNLYGNGSGVIDHCTFSGGTSSELLHDMGLNAGNLGGWQDDVVPGSSKMVFVEDSLFQVSNWQASDIYQYSTSGMQTYYGARDAIRYNLMRYVKFDTHGNIDVNGRWTEFYNNTFWTPPNQKGQSYVYDLRGGSGVFFNNTVSKDCSPTYTPVIRVYTDQTSGNNLKPAVGGPQPGYGPGAGIFQGNVSQGPTSSPVYFWGNAGINVTTSSGVGNWNPMREGQNYFVSPAQPASMKISQTASQIGGVNYSYTAYPYPHPLIAQTQGGPAPSPTPTPQPTPTPSPQPTPTPAPTPTPPQVTPTPEPTPTPGPSASPSPLVIDGDLHVKGDLQVDGNLKVGGQIKVVPKH
jgi:hypothetical protein